ncbi:MULTISPECIES: GNAT family N-acetyltransferase [Rhizobium]|uniref:Arsenate reductase n=1 Tax=Rhizobium favelukesii TaxID=348824 RepID=W6RGA6_9HYPH|nr:MULTISPECIES: GNAT family N-acetyltransferase [Rhizobium]MCS0460398.1 GNAT family N-acetyltransferase [Rhizobium favelukesii]UFS80798.1 GNAT family N-acetyltransferase [Rhizobium sp. T136]CDM57743.1 arsenate reductase [Rhizobium favelukesii]
MKLALAASGLPIEDLGYTDRSFFCASNEDGDAIGYSGIEACGGDALLRSVVVLPEHRGRELRALLVRETLAFIGEGSAVYLATTSAASFFEKLGFAAVNRADVPADVIATDNCRASAQLPQPS